MKWRIEFEGKPDCRCGGAQPDHEFPAEWCGFKTKKAKDINECLCVGLGQPGCPAVKVADDKCMWQPINNPPAAFQSSCSNFPSMFEFGRAFVGTDKTCKFCGREIEVVK